MKKVLAVALCVWMLLLVGCNISPAASTSELTGVPSSIDKPMSWLEEGASLDAVSGVDESSTGGSGARYRIVPPEGSKLPNDLYFDMSKGDVISKVGEPTEEKGLIGNTKNTNLVYRNVTFCGLNAEHILYLDDVYGLQEVQIAVRGTKGECDKALDAILPQLDQQYGKDVRQWGGDLVGWVFDDESIKDDPRIEIKVGECSEEIYGEKHFSLLVSLLRNVPLWEEVKQEKEALASDRAGERKASIVPGVTLKNFNLIHTGMLRSEIEEYLGAGTKVGENEGIDTTYTYYEWSNDLGGVIWIQFEYGRAISITQSGL